MKVLPIYPVSPASFWSWKDAIKLIGKRASNPPLGLATVAAMLPREHFDVMPIVDMNIGPLEDEQILGADLVMVTGMNVHRDCLEDIIARAHSFGKKVVAGGPYATSYREDVSADFLVLGEAEITLKPFLRDLLAGKPRKIYDEQSVLKEEGNVALTVGGKPVLSESPIPRWDLLDLSAYSSLAIQYSRGCPFGCDFCDITKLFGRELRTKTPEQIVRELDTIYRAGGRGSVFFVDDNLTGNKAEVRKMLPQIADWNKKHGRPFMFLTQASMDLALPQFQDIREGMIDAGFNSVFLGIESNDPEVLAGYHKGQNLGTIAPLDRIKIIQQAGFEVTGGFIIGSDNDKPEVFERMFDFIQEAGIPIPMVGLLSALKGTKLYQRLEKEGRLRGESLGSNTHTLGFNFEPKLDEQFLVRGYVSLLEKLFESRNYYDRCRTLESRRGVYHSNSLIDPNGLRAFATIAFENLITHPDLEFAKYLLERAVKNPRKFPEAVSNAVKLRHLQAMTNGTLSVARYQDKINALYEFYCQKAEQLKGDTMIRVHRLGEIEKEVLDRARHQYAHIRADFREHAKSAYNNLCNMISAYKKVYQLPN